LKFEYWFANIKGITGKQKMQIRARIKNAEELYYIEETEMKYLFDEEKQRKILLESRKEWNLEEEYQKLIKKNVKMVTILDEGYPEKLKEIASPPYALYVKGSLPKEETLAVAIVGARKCTPYGEKMAAIFSEALVQCDVQIISGMARGVDGISQRKALDSGGKSFAVLGCGVDICYPREHYSLYRELEEKGGVISEQPLGAEPMKHFFPARNRIISGLADVVLVIEARAQSGSLITADMALEQGKEVYALPGPVSSNLSLGCHNLIRQGAGILVSPKDLLEELGILHKNKLKKITEKKILLETPENIVYSCLDFEPKNLGYISMRTKMQIPALLNILMKLELEGYVREVSKNYYVKVK